LGDKEDSKFSYVTVNEKQYGFYTFESARNLIEMKLLTNTAAFIVAISVVGFEFSFAIGRK